MDPEISRLRARLDALERKLTSALAALNKPAAAPAEAPAGTEGVTLQSPVRVVDGEGRELLRVTRNETGGAELHLLGVNGGPAITLSARPDSNQFAIYVDGRPVVTAYGAYLGGLLALQDRHGNPIMVARSTESGGGTLVLYDDRNQAAVHLDTVPAAGGRVRVFDGEGRERMKDEG